MVTSVQDFCCNQYQLQFIISADAMPAESNQIWGRTKRCKDILLLFTAYTLYLTTFTYIYVYAKVNEFVLFLCTTSTAQCKQIYWETWEIFKLMQPLKKSYARLEINSITDIFNVSAHLYTRYITTMYTFLFIYYILS